ncbi:MAG: phage terminase large subunit [Trueperaceae bacterium]|nr:phage terminase large subunit [Trueperaceae bacterium]
MARLRELTTPKSSPYWLHRPTPKQAAFLLVPHREVLFGGAAGGGKSDALLMGALQYVDHSGYSALILRTTLTAMKLSDGLIPRSHEWLEETPAVWSQQDKQWTFPSGATLKFGYLENEKDKYRYSSSAFQFIGFEELTEFKRETDYRFLFSRLRRTKDMDVPLRMRATTNPIGPGFEWVRRRFVDGESPNRLFIPSTLEDNPYLDTEEYLESLGELDPATKKKLENGDWGDLEQGDLFAKPMFPVRDRVEGQIEAIVRFWDFAATPVSDNNPDPDWLVGTLIAKTTRERWWILDVERGRYGPDGVEKTIEDTAKVDGRNIPIVFELEGGSQSKIATHQLATRTLAGWDVHTQTASKDKTTRALPFASQARQRNVWLLRGGWNDDWLDELSGFPNGAHDDQVDSASGGFAYLVTEYKPDFQQPPRRVIR